MKTICCIPNIQALAWKRIQQDLSSFNSLIPTALMVSMLNLVLFCHFIESKCNVHLVACCYKQILVGKALAEAHSNNALLQPIWMKKFHGRSLILRFEMLQEISLFCWNRKTLPVYLYKLTLITIFPVIILVEKKTESKEGLTKNPA